ncbi:helicase HerA-like domain-containing protein [Ancylobacter amanitiformis]|uniref:DNA helicase HerA-like ATPase n=1 Tax=Ancylobacter amanitiformis TaxID=217069 RepID=A0ABU0LQD3_9HYPH|nr:helicase HerA-like domain-containing protein [Ancylobacter amanitiformis]MDQ0510912.1 DNA helicase HerA-like ATPase [Ancylobacter amanitiformis]
MRVDLAPGHGIALKYANRHGLITGSTGAGKTTTLQRLAEGFSAAGVPVFAADVKGDLSGVSTAFPVRFWDVFGDLGMPIKTSVEEMGPDLMARLLNLNATQEGVLHVAYRWLSDPDFHPGASLMMDLDGLRASITDMLDHREALRTRHGNVTAASIGAIQRSMLVLEGQGGGNLFGEPSFDIMDLLETAPDGRGVINLLAAQRLMDAPRTYGALMQWLLMRLFAALPEAGDLDKPKLVIFLDEAHLLFDGASRTILDTIERTVRLIRSKGVGVYFVTQHPLDVPESVLGQLGNKIQHSLRAFTPRDARAVRTAAASFRQNPDVEAEREITEMRVGEALVSFLDAGGAPSPVQKVKIDFPTAQVGPIRFGQRMDMIRQDPLADHYGVTFDDRDAMFDAFRARYQNNQAVKAIQAEEVQSWRRASNMTASPPSSSATDCAMQV